MTTWAVDFFHPRLNESAAPGDNVECEWIAKILWRRSAGIETAVPDEGKDFVLASSACLYKSEPIASGVLVRPAGT